MKPIFRSAMFGFHKDDVFNFISKQNKLYEAKISEITAEKNKLLEEFEEERKGFERDAYEIETLRNALYESRELLFSISDIVTEILNDQTRISGCASLIREDRSEVLTKFAEMKSRVDEAEKLRVKAEKFDQLSGVLSSIFNQPEISAANAVSVDTPVDTYQPEELQAFADLFELLEVLSARCEKLKGMISEGQENA